MTKQKPWDALIVGGGIAGLSAAIYLGRAQTRTLVVDSGRSMARWEPDVQNYLGFPEGIAGTELLERGRRQAKRYGVSFAQDEVLHVTPKQKEFSVRGGRNTYRAKFLLLATGIFHNPPEINGVSSCLGHSIFFCKDCDGVRVRDKKIAIYGSNNDTAAYALGMLAFSRSVAIVTNTHPITWDRRSAKLLKRYKVPIHQQRIRMACHERKLIQSLQFVDDSVMPIDALFTTRGDVFHNDLARKLGAKIKDEEVRQFPLPQSRHPMASV